MKRLSSHILAALVVLSLAVPSLRGADDEGAEPSASDAVLETDAAAETDKEAASDEEAGTDKEDETGKEAGTECDCTDCVAGRILRRSAAALGGCAYCAGGRLAAIGGCPNCGGGRLATGGCANCGGRLGANGGCSRCAGQNGIHNHGNHGHLRNLHGYVQDLRNYMHNAMHEYVHPHPWYAYSDYGNYASLHHHWNMQQSMRIPWHGGYRHTEWGAPVALVVPPTSDNRTIWSWGVGQTRSVPIYHQFRRGVPAGVPTRTAGSAGDGQRGIQFRPTPMWPSNTDQFGVYPVRGPW